MLTSPQIKRVKNCEVMVTAYSSLLYQMISSSNIISVLYMLIIECAEYLGWNDLWNCGSDIDTNRHHPEI